MKVHRLITCKNLCEMFLNLIKKTEEEVGVLLSQKTINKLHKQGSAAVILAGSFGALALIREFGKHSIPCIVIGKKYIQTSRYASVILKTQSNDDIPQILLLLPQLIKIPLVLLTDDDHYLQLIERNWEQLIPYYRIPASLGNKKLTDKTTLAKIKNQTGVLIPKTFKNYKEIPENGYPVIIKPLIQQRRVVHPNTQPKKAYICCSKEEVLQTIKVLNELKLPFLIQELIQGSAAKIYNVLLYRNPNGRIIVGFVSKKLRSFPLGFGTGSAQITEKNDMLIEQSIRLMEQASYVGTAEFEYKFCDCKKVFYLIEVNGRFPLQCSLLHKANPSFISIIFQDLIKPSKACNHTLFTENIVWLYFLNDVRAHQAEKRNILPVYCKLLFKYSIQYAVWKWSDPLPSFYYGLYLINRICRKKPSFFKC